MEDRIFISDRQTQIFLTEKEKKPRDHKKAAENCRRALFCSCIWRDCKCGVSDNKFLLFSEKKEDRKIF